MVDTAVVVTVTGEIDHSNAEQLEGAVDAALERAGLPEEAGVVALDLCGVTFLGSAGLSALISASRQAKGSGKPLRIVVDEHRPVIRPIQLAGLQDLLALCYNVAAALALEV
jgi:anti-sigma B factor antagonist